MRGEPPPADLKVALNYAGGYRNSMALVLEGLDIAAKARLAEQTIWARVPGGKDSFDAVDVDLVGSDPALLRISVLDQDKAKVGRAFSAAVVETGLASYPGFYALSPPGDASAYGVYWPTTDPGRAGHHDGRDRRRAGVDWPGPERAGPVRCRRARQPAATPPTARAANAAPTAPSDSAEATPAGTTPGPRSRRVPLGTVAGARSGDKGGNANLGVWVRTQAEYAWLERYLTADRLAELVSGVAGLPVERYCLPNLLAINFVIVGLLGRGVAASTRLDPQAKALGEELRAALADVPTDLLPPPTSAG